MSRNKTRVKRFLKIFVKLTENLTFFKLLLMSINRVYNISWIPFQKLYFRHLFGFNMLFKLWPHLLLIELFESDNLLHKILVINFITEWFVVWECWIDSKYDWQFILHSGPKLIELLLRKVQLELIILFKDFVILWDWSFTPFLMNLFGSTFVFMVSACRSFTHLVKYL